MQGIFQNPLVDPYVLGISSGAALGAVIAILSGVYLGFFTVPLFAFSMALFSAFLVFYLGKIGKRFPLEVLLLAGIGVGFFFSCSGISGDVFSRRRPAPAIFLDYGRAVE